MESERMGDSLANRRLTQLREAQEIEEQRATMEKTRNDRDRQVRLEAQKEEAERSMVDISRQATNQLEAARKFNQDQVHALTETQRANYETLAKKTAEQVKAIDDRGQAIIDAHKFDSLERIKVVTDRELDPFYHRKSLDPTLRENEKSYLIQVAMAEHEIPNLFVSGDGPYIKLSLARRFQDSAKAPEGNRTTTTNSYQSVVEQIAMPGAYDAKRIERSFENGMMTLTVPKLIFGANPEKIKA